MAAKQYINELAPWEKKADYYSAVSLGVPAREQQVQLIEAIERQTRTQLAAASAIVVSQERVREGVSKLASKTESGLNKVAGSIEDLQASFEFGISQVVWQLEQERAELKRILEVLQAPLDTQARERRKRAEIAFSNGWIDDAEEEFIESRKLNKYDFSIHISMGMIYQFSKIDKNKALECFEKAIQYARPESNFYTSYALLYKAIIKRDMGLLEEAEECAVEAASLSPDFLEASYQAAKYNAILNKPDKSISFLKAIARKDVRYLLKTDVDDDFNSIRDVVNAFLEEFRVSYGKDIAEELEGYRKKVEAMRSNLNGLNAKISDPIKLDISKIESVVPRAGELIKRNSILDIYEAELLIDKAEQSYNELASRLSQEKSSAIGQRNNEIETLMAARKKFNGTMSKVAGVSVFIIMELVVIILVSSHTDSYQLVWGIIVAVIVGYPILFVAGAVIELYEIISKTKLFLPAEVGVLRNEIESINASHL